MIKSILSMLIPMSIFAQTVAVKTIDPINIPVDHVYPVVTRIQEVCTGYMETVDRTTGLGDILHEHALRQSGVMGDVGDTLALRSATQIISGSVGCTGSWWYIDLTLTDVQTGRVLRTRHAKVSSYVELLSIVKPVTKALLTGTQLEDDEQVSSVRDDRPIIMGTDKHIHEVHVIQHAPGTTGKERFVPCSYCGGRGTVPYKCPTGYKDCPYCSASSSYKGPETHGEYLTGHWMK